MTIKMKIIFSLAVMFFVVFQRAVLAEETNLQIAPIEVQSAQPFNVPVKIDQVEKLAGVKLVLIYDSKFLTYEKTEKSETTSKLMHMVNDKEPGKLIIVMAGAKGISGKEMDILTIYFKAAANIRGKFVTKIQLAEIELVSDQLKEIPCNLSESIITILPEIK